MKAVVEKCLCCYSRAMLNWRQRYVYYCQDKGSPDMYVSWCNTIRDAKIFLNQCLKPSRIICYYIIQGLAPRRNIFVQALYRTANMSCHWVSRRTRSTVTPVVNSAHDLAEQQQRLPLHGAVTVWNRTQASITHSGEFTCKVA